LKALEFLKSASKASNRLTLLSDENALSKVKYWIPTGCPPLDHIMGGGVPVGRTMEVYGDTSTGKTAIGASILAGTQDMGGVAVLLDTETAVDEDFMSILGVDVDELIYSNPNTVEDVWDDILAVIDARNQVAPESLLTIVWDSVAATSSEEELKKLRKEGLGGSTVATHARQISKMFRAAKGLMASEAVAFVAINQTRSKIGVMFGSNVTTFGGKAIGFYSSVRLELTSVSPCRDNNDNVIGVNTRVKVAKSRVSKPFGKCRIPIRFDVGIDEAESVYMWIKDRKLAKVKGSWTKLMVGGKELSFQHSGWDDMYWDNRDAILELLFGGE